MTVFKISLNELLSDIDSFLNTKTGSAKILKNEKHVGNFYIIAMCGPESGFGSTTISFSFFKDNDIQTILIISESVKLIEFLCNNKSGEVGKFLAVETYSQKNNPGTKYFVTFNIDRLKNEIEININKENNDDCCSSHSCSSHDHDHSHSHDHHHR